MPKPFSQTGLRFLWISVVVIALDLWTKYQVLGSMRLFQSIEVTPFFNLTYVHNYGAAFSFLADADGWQRWFFTAIALKCDASFFAKVFGGLFNDRKIIIL